MTKKIYKSAQGKTVDLGALILQNENIRAVGNMNVNARGDVLDSTDRVIDNKSNQIQRQQQRQTRTAVPREIHTSNQAARASQSKTVLETVLDTPVEASPTENSGLAGALARSRKQSDNK